MNFCKIIFCVVFLGLFLSPSRASTAPEPILSQSIDGVEFSVIDVQRDVRKQKRYHMQTDWVKKETSPEGVEIEYIAITYQVTNKNLTKKINMDSSFQFHLLDEYENQYRKIPKPDSFEDAVMFTDKHFPSIYPNEIFKETIFFESPIKATTRLTLLIKANPLGEGKIAKLILPVGEIAAVPVAVDGDAETESPVVPVIAQQEKRSVKIVNPPTGKLINRGEAIQIHVVTTGNPNNIIVATLGTSYYDPSPQDKNVYDVRVPFGYYTGALSINVIAEWDSTVDEEPFVVSDTIFLDVMSPYRALQGQDRPIFEYFK